jgi:hypothetical protein
MMRMWRDSSGVPCPMVFYFPFMTLDPLRLVLGLLALALCLKKTLGRLSCDEETYLGSEIRIFPS